VSIAILGGEPGDQVVRSERTGPRGQVIVGPWRARPAPLRLTRRGRLVLTGMIAAGLLLSMLAAVLLLDRVALAGPESGAAIPVSYHVVAPGETLWQLAGEVAPDADRRETVARIRELNALDGAAVSAGQRLALPAP
jgi:LysM repeat protein